MFTKEQNIFLYKAVLLVELVYNNPFVIKFLFNDENEGEERKEVLEQAAQIKAIFESTYTEVKGL